MKVVVCGSYGDLETFCEVLEKERQEFGKENVFPTDDHLRESQICIEAHHLGKGETRKTVEQRAMLMQRYFDHIDEADLVVVVNEKKGQEHYGIGTMMEVGYAFAIGKNMNFIRVVTDSNVRSLLNLMRKG